ncbi:MAG: NAD(P)H-hydrate dehydratase [Gaiellaceae bacterium]|jgi:NAD(P)H-hydrate epimerase
MSSKPYFEPLFSAAEMRVVEEAYPGYPSSMRELMLRAGTAAAEAAIRRFPEARSYTVVCGGGSNGGDGLVAADVLRAQGREVLIVEAKSGEKELGSPDVIVDALFGTGFSGEPRADAASLIEKMNAAGAPVVSVDIASGVDASNGEIAGPAVKAALTVTFYARKVGHVVAPGRFQRGELEIADIGLAGGTTAARLATLELLSAIPRRKESDTKFSAGSVLVVGGSPGFSGAVCLAGEAAFRADAGYVTVVVPRSVLPPLELRLLEAVKRPAPEDEAGHLTAEALALVSELEPRAQSLALGPGIGRTEGTREFVRELLFRTSLPAVVDADALFGLEPGRWAAPVVLTPHAGELARLLGKESAWVNAHRLAAARECAERFLAVTLLKGADTIVVSPSGEALVCEQGTPALATAGSGDVLTGVIAAFLAKGLEPVLAAAAAAVAHGRAAQLLEHQVGVVAGDVTRMLPEAICEGR